MIEYRTERIDPRYEESTLKTYAAFGWTLIDSQEIYNENTEISGAEIKQYGAFMQGYTGHVGKIDMKSTTRVTHFLSMRFGRDTQMHGYEQLRELEEKFYACASTPNPKTPVKRTAITVIGIILIVLSIIFAIVDGTQAEPWEIAVCIIFPLVFIPLTIFGWSQYRKRLSQYEYAIITGRNIIAQACAIVDGENL